MIERSFSQVAELAKRKTVQDLAALSALEPALYLQNILIGIAEIFKDSDRSRRYLIAVSRSTAEPSKNGAPPEIVRDLLCARSRVPVRRERGCIDTDIVRLAIRDNGIEDCTGYHSVPIVKLNGRTELTEQELDVLFDAVHRRFLEVKMEDVVPVKNPAPLPA